MFWYLLLSVYLQNMLWCLGKSGFHRVLQTLWGRYGTKVGVIAETADFVIVTALKWPQRTAVIVIRDVTKASRPSFRDS